MTKSKETRFERIARLAEEINAICKKMNFNVITAHQYPRQGATHSLYVRSPSEIVFVDHIHTLEK